MASKTDTTKFVVDLGPLQVPSGMAKELEAEMQQLALRTLARIDYRGNLKIGRLPPGVYGYTFDEWPPDFPDLDPWWPRPGEGPTTPILRAKVHTELVRLAMDRSLPILRQLASGGSRQRPTGADVIAAMLEMRELGGSQRRALEEARKIADQSAAARLPRRASSAVAEFSKQVDAARSLSDVEKVLARARDDAELAQVSGLAEGLEVAQAMVEDGRDTIYSPDDPFYVGTDGTRVAASIVKEDVKGAVVGAVTVAVVTGGAGAGAGALGGGLTSSLGEAVGEVWDAITSIFD